MGGGTPLVPVLRRQKQADVCGFKASLVYMVRVGSQKQTKAMGRRNGKVCQFNSASWNLQRSPHFLHFWFQPKLIMNLTLSQVLTKSWWPSNHGALWLTNTQTSLFYNYLHNWYLRYLLLCPHISPTFLSSVSLRNSLVLQWWVYCLFLCICLLICVREVPWFNESHKETRLLNSSPVAHNWFQRNMGDSRGIGTFPLSLRNKHTCLMPFLAAVWGKLLIIRLKSGCEGRSSAFVHPWLTLFSP